MVRAWYVDNDPNNMQETHMTDPPEFLSLVELNQFGVNYWQVDADNYETCEKLKAIRKEKNYDYEDQIVCHRGCSSYEDMVKEFFEEHIHFHDETRLIVDGSGYFDIRHPRNDRWIRIEVVKNDMISIPAGLYHRFTPDTKDYIKGNRYFSGNPDWTVLNCPQDDNPVRVDYLKTYGFF